MILSNMRLVVSTADGPKRACRDPPLASKWGRRRPAPRGFGGRGDAGLATAVDRYDPGRGFHSVRMRSGGCGKRSKSSGARSWPCLDMRELGKQWKMPLGIGGC